MHKLLVLCGAILCLSFTAAAQDTTAALDASSPASEQGGGSAFSPNDRSSWQFGAGFQYQHYSLPSLNFHTLGYNVDVTRYLTNWFGVEGTAAFGYGSVGTPSVALNSLFVGGGPHIVMTNGSRIEPWGHVLAGWQRFRFAQGPTLGTVAQAGFMAGGGVDYKFRGQLYWRVQADFIGTEFGHSLDKNYSFGTGLIYNF